MKKIKFILGILLTVLVMACEKEYEPLNNLSDVKWLTGMTGKSNNLALNKYMTFADLSQGLVSHQWSVSDTSGILFLNGNITNGVTDYTPFIREDQSRETNDKTVHLLFNKAGEQTVRLYNVFDDYVEFRGNDTIPAKYDESIGAWVMDTAFIVDVYDTLQPAFQVFFNNEMIVDVAYDEHISLNDSLEWPVVNIEAGDSVQYVDKTLIDRPTGRRWDLDGASPSNSSGEDSYIPYYRLGKFRGSMTSQRNGTNIPGGEKLKHIPVWIQVNKSSQPFNAVSGKKLENEVVQIAFNGEVQALDINEKDNFTVSVKNTVAGFDEIIPVSSASVNSSEGNIIDLKLSQAIYNTDVITVSWTGGNIKSLDDRDLTPFTNQSISITLIDLMADKDTYGFEAGSFTAAGWSFDWDNIGSAEVSSDMASSGTYSLKMRLEKGGNNKISGPKEDLTMIEGKTYKFSYKYYRSGNNPCFNSVTPRLLPWGGEKPFWSDLPTTGNWGYYEQVFEYTSGSAERWLNIQGIDNDDCTGTNTTIYFDEFSLIDWEPRK